jgi:hypothetical protein
MLISWIQHGTSTWRSELMMIYFKRNKATTSNAKIHTTCHCFQQCILRICSINLSFLVVQKGLSPNALLRAHVDTGHHNPFSFTSWKASMCLFKSAQRPNLLLRHAGLLHLNT